VRGAIRLLEEVGFLDRAVTSGSTHQPTPDGLHRRPVLFMFGALFGKANRRAQEAKERRSRSRGGVPLKVARAPVRLSEAWRVGSPKSRVSETGMVLMGDLRPNPATLLEPNSNLEAALDRWKKAFEQATP